MNKKIKIVQKVFDMICTIGALPCVLLTYGVVSLCSFLDESAQNFWKQED